jgi:hypothetical protein
MDMPTLAALLGHTKLNMMMRYAHAQERHQADSVKTLEAINLIENRRQVSSNKLRGADRIRTDEGSAVPSVPVQ